VSALVVGSGVGSGARVGSPVGQPAKRLTNVSAYSMIRDKRI
jgi:hypothetical protein